ncbi:LAQU0S02e02542g1_1 [Lachancea quebecensis]|uniref:LAQU0S02e02542g1_1 n=1 Tax=Lachancea quebecensis TaxID=1654605 RepID=A0A0P1KM91_9SACH|nr:LAQU0S02e02542g1_1 [Lachancea quebecensis]
MFILDEIYTSKESFHDVVGGGGMFAVLGASIVASAYGLSRQLRWIVDRGSDFPSSATDILESWETGVVYRDDSSRLTTRAWNLYGENDLRQFKYLSEKKRIDVGDWVAEFGADEVASMRVFHLLCVDDRASSFLNSLRPYEGSDDRVFVWEPIPDLCDSARRDEIRAVMNREETIVVSPNAEEGARLFGVPEPLDLEQCANLLGRFDDFVSDKNMCVLRCGKLGSLALGARNRQSGLRQVVHMPAYHSRSASQVLDPTGGGNTFLGGFSLGYALSHGDLAVASICGNIAAACAIEQLGVPKREGDMWNGKTFLARLDHYLKEFQLGYTIEDISKALEAGV